MIHRNTMFPFLPVLLCAVAAVCGTNGSLYATPQKTTAVIFEQNFLWNDMLGSGDYTLNEENYFRMDGSHGKIQCRRKLKDKMVDASSRIEVIMTLETGKMYRFPFYDSDGNIAVDCRIDRDGHVLFSNGTTFVDSGVITGPKPRIWAVCADLDLIFGQFDFKAKKFNFTFNGKSIPDMPLCSSVSDIGFFEVQTDIVEPGTVVWLDRFKQIKEPNTVIDNEEFNHTWIPIPPIPAFDPDKTQLITYRPKDYKWLEGCSRYGSVWMKFSNAPVPNGEIECEIIADNVDDEIQLNLGEYDRPFESCPQGGWKANVGIFAGVWNPFNKPVANSSPSMTKPFNTFVGFDNAPNPIINRVYKLTLQWNTEKQNYRVWIDGVSQNYNGSPDIPMLHPVKKGLDFVMIHFGNRNPDIGPLIYCRWGNIKITSE